MKIDTRPLDEITVARFRRLRAVVDMDPAYQREGNVWKVETRSKLIDSIINGLDVPKLYFEKLSTSKRGPAGLPYDYAAIDGKQRLEAITAFAEGEIGLPDDFWFFEDDSVRAQTMDISQLEHTYPALANRFWNFVLPIVVVRTDSGDLIEEMFQRLNASSALNAAERRNSIQGPTREAANVLAEHSLLMEKSPIRSARYKYRELGSKFLAIEHQIAQKGKIVDTKATTLYDLFTATRGSHPIISERDMLKYRGQAHAVLDSMDETFINDDVLLRSIGTLVVYYVAFRSSVFTDNVTREFLAAFETHRRLAADMAETDVQYNNPANIRLREYNVWVQSTNDGTALMRRSEIISTYVAGAAEGDALAAIGRMSDGAVPAEDDSSE